MKLELVLALVTVVLVAIYLIGLAVLACWQPKIASAFLTSMASSAKAHFLEAAIRLMVGTALVIYSPQMLFADIFWLFGWVIIVTTIGLLALPWELHHRFAAWSVPYATRNMALFGLGSLAGGVFVLAAVVFGPSR
jgi:hypothetical protein